MPQKTNIHRDKSGARPPDMGSVFKGAGTHIQHSLEELIPKLVTTACNIPDIAQGRAQLGDLVRSAFHSKFGAAEHGTQIELTRVEDEKQVALNDLKSARTLKDETPELIPTARVNSIRGDEDANEVSWRDWQIRHKIESVVLCILLPAALLASAFTAHANLVGTGLPIFLENQFLAWTMACMAPTSGLVFKLIASSFRSDKVHRLLTTILNGIAVILVFCWICLFADQFHGLSSDIGTGDLFHEPSAWESIRDTIFVAVTLLTEVTIGAVLADRLDRIARNYSPNYWFWNPESETIDKRVSTLVTKIAELTDEEAKLKGALTEFQQSLNLQIQLAQLAYDARRARFDEGNIT